MKKILHLVVILCSVIAFDAIAQDRTVTGKVTAEDDGSPLPGVNVFLKDTNVGTVTDISGKFSLNVPTDGGIIVISFIGFQTLEIDVANQSEFNISLKSDVTQLGEVVITSLNIEREKKSLGYATQQIKGEDLRVARETNINSALAGKVSGVQVVSGSGAKFGTSKIRIRGVRGLNSADPLYVMDGIIVDDPSIINMDAVESVNVLKGANAAALYGNRARDGVVIITTQSGKSGDLSIRFNNTTTFERVATMPKYQNQYGGGYSQDWTTFEFDPAKDDPALSGLDGAKIPEFYADESWGPYMDGSQVAQWDAFTPGTEGYGKTRPWSPHPDNVRDFFNTGVFMQNSLSASKATDLYGFNITFTNSQRTGVLPNTSQDKTFLNLNSKVNLSDKLKMTAIANYSRRETFGNLTEGYQDGAIGTNFNQWFQRQVDIGLLKKYYQMPDGRYTSWNLNSARNSTPLYWNNPYTEVYANTSENSKEVFSGKFGLSYEIIDGLVASANFTRSTDQRYGEWRIASGTLHTDGFGTWSGNIREDNYEFITSYNTNLGESFSISALAGGNLRKNDWNYSELNTVGGLSVDNLFNISASNDRPGTTNQVAKQEVRSLFAQVSLGYKGTLFVDATTRRDWDSTLPVDDNAFTYSSISTSFIFSELINALDVLSFGKVRISYAGAGGELDPYRLTPVYGLGSPYNGLATMGVPNSITDPGLTPAVTDAYEAGIELNFLNNLIKLDFSYYNYDNTDEIIEVALPGTTGVSEFVINSGRTTTKGWDASLGINPIKNQNFDWEIMFNFAKSENFLDELYPGLDAFSLENGWLGTGSTGGWAGITAKAEVGKEWGTIVGRSFVRDDAGNIVVDADGTPLYESNVDLGHILPDYTGGIYNRFVYKDFVLSFTIDWQIGGKFHSITKMFNAYSGLSAETVGNNDKGNPMRDPVANGGGLKFDGVFEDGSANNVYLEADTYWKSLFALHERWLYDATFVKMREIRLGYSLPTGLLSNTFIKNASVSVVANNPWLIHTKVDGIDPSEISGDTEDARNNGAWVESGNLPGTRSIGFDIRLGF